MPRDRVERHTGRIVRSEGHGAERVQDHRGVRQSILVEIPWLQFEDEAGRWIGHEKSAVRWISRQAGWTADSQGDGRDPAERVPQPVDSRQSSESGIADVEIVARPP